MQYVTTNIPASYDREWIAQKGGFITWIKDPTPFTPEGASEEYVAWNYCAPNAQIALELIYNYPVAYLEKKLAEAKVVIERKLQSEFQKGFQVPAGTMAGQILQVRDMEDRTNWLTSQVTYTAAVAMGKGDLPGATFRTANNETFTVSFTEGVTVLLGMAKWGADIMARSWALKDAAKSAANIDALAVVMNDIAKGWPSGT